LTHQPQVDLERLERVISGILRAGVAIGAVAMLIGLGMMAAGRPASVGVLNAGLILIMMIPSARILASLVDAIYRRDTLLALATATVSLIIAEEVFRKVFF
jgi:uncharacterized membrane protein